MTASSAWSFLRRNNGTAHAFPVPLAAVWPPVDPNPPSARADPGKPLHLVEPRMLDALHHELGDPVTAGERHRIPGVEVHHRDLDLSAVSGIDGTRRVHQAHPMAHREPRAGVDERGVAGGQGDRQAGREERSLPRRQGGVHRRAEVDAGVAGPGVLGHGQARVEPDHEDVHAAHGFTSKLPDRLEDGSLGNGRGHVLGTAVGPEVLEPDGDEQRSGVDRDRTVPVVQPPDRRGPDLAALHAGDLGVDVQRGPDGTGRRKSVSRRAVTAGVRVSQLSAPRDSSKAVDSSPPWASPGAPWWCSVTVKVERSVSPSPATTLEVEPRRVLGTAAEAAQVVRPERCPRRRRVGVALRHRGTGRRGRGQRRGHLADPTAGPERPRCDPCAMTAPATTTASGCPSRWLSGSVTLAFWALFSFALGATLGPWVGVPLVVLGCAGAGGRPARRAAGGSRSSTGPWSPVVRRCRSPSPVRSSRWTPLPPGSCAGPAPTAAPTSTCAAGCRPRSASTSPTRRPDALLVRLHAAPDRAGRSGGRCPAGPEG